MHIYGTLLTQSLFTPTRGFFLILIPPLKNLLLHATDQRKIPPLGRIPEPDDILASVRVEDGQMLMETYEPMPSYRLCTADGVCQLTDTLMDRLKAALRQIVEEEEEEEEEQVGKDGQAR